jgi:uncharacterized membrane protein SpoIIM required for sporulation
MRRKFAPVMLIVRRELRDHLRDWRILFPMFVLMIIFPLLMNAVAFQAVEFVHRYGGEIIVDRLVPFSVLIIGFFPLTISLVAALESFVGEKERGTIEPLLSAPLENWQIYTGKLFVGIVVPLTASFASIVLYLLLVSYQEITMPGWATILQLFSLTAAHAILMTSAAIVISVQSTSVKAANLLASFIVVPVGILMQGESAVLFWGNEAALWLVILAVLILAFLLVRLGIAHFNREYLLGREIDTVNIRWVLRAFWHRFSGQATSLADWYGRVLWRSVTRLAISLAVILMMAVAGGWLSYEWTVANIPTLLHKLSEKDVSTLIDKLTNTYDFAKLKSQVNAPYIFSHNVRAVLSTLLAGMVSFSVLGMIFYLINVGMVGGALGLFKIAGLPPLLLFGAGLLPHGVFEIPALMLSAASVLYMGVTFVTPQLGKSMGEVLIDLLADWAKIFIGLIVPLLALAAVIETYITPVILSAALGR